MKSASLHYEEKGPADAPVIVFLHGFMGQANAWHCMMESLAGNFHSIAFDLPGHGASLFKNSERLEQLRGMEDAADLILQDLSALGVNRFSLYGYSMGGRVAQHIALGAPARIEKLILESASFGIADAAQRATRLQQDQGLMANIKTKEDFSAFLTQWYHLPLFQSLRGTPHISTLITDKINHPVAEYHRALNLLSVGGHSFLADGLSKCRLPIYYFCGAQDEAYVQTAREIKKMLPEMTVKIFKNASHNIHIQQPQEIVSAIRKILI